MDRWLPESFQEFVAVRRIGEAFGFAGELAHVTLAGGGTVVVKRAPLAAARAEAAFYTTIGPTLDVPLAHFHRAFEEGGHGWLVLEDLTDCEPGDVMAGATAPRALALARAAARWHGPFWGRAPVELPRWADNRSGWLDTARPTLAALGRPLPAAVDDALPSLIGELSAAPSTLIHGDLHLDNVLFRGDVPVVLDWANVRRGPAAFDLVRLLVEGLRSDDRAVLHEPVLAAWLAAIDATGVRYDRAELDRHLFLAAIALLVGTARWNQAPGRPVHPRIPPLIEEVLDRTVSLLDAGHPR